jgi:hypothetical protein
MTIGKEIPFRRGAHHRDTGSLVFDQERKAAPDEGGDVRKIKLPKRERPDTKH